MLRREQQTKLEKTMYKVKFYQGFTGPVNDSNEFQHWHQANAELTRLMAIEGVTGADIYEFVSEFVGWTLSNEQPEQYLVECSISGVGKYFDDVVTALDYASDNFRFELDSTRNKVYDCRTGNLLAIYEKSGFKWERN